MTTIQKQRMFWLAGLALAALYFAPSIINSVRRTAVNREQNIVRPAKPQAGKNASPLPIPGAALPPVAAGTSPNASPLASTTTSTPAPSDDLLGIWQGFGALPGLGMCNLKLEVRRNALQPDHFSGFPVLICMPVPTTTATVRRGAAARSPILPQMSTLSAVLTGTAKDGAIQFTVDKIIGKDAAGCALTAFTVTPFGTDQIAAEWKEGSCTGQAGAQILLRRIGK